MPLLLKEDGAQLEQAWKGEVRVPGGLGNTANSEGRYDTNTPLNTPVVLPHVISGRHTRIDSPKQLQETGGEPSGKAAGGGHAAAWAHSLEHPQHGRHLETAPTHFPQPVCESTWLYNGHTSPGRGI